MPAQKRKLGKEDLDGYLIECDIPTMQFIKNLEDTMKRNPNDNVFITLPLDATHCFIKKSYKDMVARKVDEWLDGVSVAWFSIVILFAE